MHGTGVLVVLTFWEMDDTVLTTRTRGRGVNTCIDTKACIAIMCVYANEVIACLLS